MSSHTQRNSRESDVLISNIISLQDIVARILSLLHSRHKGALDESLRLILDFFSADRVSLAGLDDKTREIYFLCQVNRKDVPALPFVYNRRIPMAKRCWMLDKLLQDEILAVDDLSQLPPKAISDKCFMECIHTQSYLVSPAQMDDQMKGFLVLESIRSPRKWLPMECENLRILANLIAFGIEQEQARKAMTYSSRQLVKNELFFSLIFDNLAWAVELYDANGCLVDMNPADLELFGYTREEAKGISLYENPNIPEDQKERLRAGKEVSFELFYDFGLTKHTGYFSSRYEKGNKLIRGHIIPLKDAFENVLLFVVLLFDDTENYLKNEELKRNLAKLDAAVDTDESFLWEFDAREESGDELLEFDLENPFGKKKKARVHNPRTLKELFNSIHPEDLPSIFGYHNRIMSGEIDHSTATYRRIVEGETYWYTSNIRVETRGKNGRPQKILCYTTDITREKEQEAELMKAQETDRLKSAFMGNISHEVRTPLNSIVGFSNFLVDLNSTPETEKFREIINNNNSLLLQLVDDILDFSKIELGALECCYTHVSVKDVCEETIRLYEPMLKKGVKFAFDPDLPHYMVHADRKRMRQVLAQFISNALKYTNKGTIVLSYEKTDGNQCLIKLKDTGIGLSSEVKKKVFNTFYKENEFNQGVGLGLSIAKAIVEAMGGQIGVESTKGEGSVFWCTLPLVDSIN